MGLDSACGTGPAGAGGPNGALELWFAERQTPSVQLACRVSRTLVRRRTAHHDLAILETEPFGRMLVLNGAIQLTLADEFVYHEMLAHVPLSAHPDPRRVLVVGGGDGGTVREVLRHPGVEEVVLAEIDGDVVEACRNYLPEVASALSDPRVHLAIGDGVRHVQEHPQAYDVILVDSTDPVGPATQLFGPAFVESCRRALRPGGLLAAQTESPFFHGDLIAASFGHFRSTFPIARLYLAPVPTYPSGLWSFTVGSLGPDPARPVREEPTVRSAARYYTPEVHRAAFALPGFVRRLVEVPVPGEMATPS